MDKNLRFRGDKNNFFFFEIVVVKNKTSCIFATLLADGISQKQNHI
jgi:hypothetical protein